MPGLTSLMPSLVVLLLTVAAAVPLGLGADARFAALLLPLLAIAHVSVRMPDRMPAIVAFLSGLVLDVLTHGPLGYWSLVFLAGHISAAMLSEPGSATLLSTWPRVAAALAAATTAEWLAHTLYFVEPAETGRRLTALATALLAYPIMAIAMRRLDGSPSARRTLNLERRG